MMPGKPSRFFTVDEIDRLLSANGGMVSVELMDVLKGIITQHVVNALEPYVEPTGLPRHTPMALDADGHGPVDKNDIESEDHMGCWCPDPRCWLTMSLRHQEAITMRWSADLLEAQGLGEMAAFVRRDAADLEEEYDLRR